MTITNTVLSQPSKQSLTSRKLSNLLRECRNEMNEMKSELFDIQNALNACRSSLGKLELSDEASSSPSSATSTSDSSSLQSPTRLSRCNSPVLVNFVKEQASSFSTMLNGPLLSRPIIKRKQLKAAIRSGNQSQRNHRKASSTKNSSQFTNSISCSSSISLANSSISSDYPSTSTYNFMPKSPPQYVKRYSKQLNRTLRCAGKNILVLNEPVGRETKAVKQQQQIVASSTAATTITTTTTTTDEYSTKITTCNYNNEKSGDDLKSAKAVSRFTASEASSTPISCKPTKSGRHPDYQQYNHYTISASKIKLQKSGRVSNIVKVYNHYHKNHKRNAGFASLNGNTGCRNYARLQIENHRTNQTKLNVFKLTSSARAESSGGAGAVEKSVIKYKPLKTNTNLSTQFYTRLEEQNSVDSGSVHDFGSGGGGKDSNRLRDHFLVINHKSATELSQSNFEPQLSSTPIIKEPKTSTPDLMRNSYFEKIIMELASKSHIKIRGNLGQSNDYARHLDTLSRGGGDDDESGYTIPGPRAKDNEYQVPNVGARGTEGSADCYDPLANEDYNNPFLFFKFPTTTSTPILNSRAVPKRHAYKSCKYQQPLMHGGAVDKDGPSKTDKILAPAQQIHLPFDQLPLPIPQCEANTFELSNMTSSLSIFDRNKPTSEVELNEDKKLKNTTIMSNASTVTTVIKCCMRPFRNFMHSKNMKRCLKKIQ